MWCAPSKRGKKQENRGASIIDFQICSNWSNHTFQVWCPCVSTQQAWDLWWAPSDRGKASAKQGVFWPLREIWNRRNIRKLPLENGPRQMTCGSIIASEDNAPLHTFFAILGFQIWCWFGAGTRTWSSCLRNEIGIYTFITCDGWWWWAFEARVGG